MSYSQKPHERPENSNKTPHYRSKTVLHSSFMLKKLECNTKITNKDWTAL